MLRKLAVGVLFMIGLTPVFAQPDLTETFITDDGTIQVNYPEEWEAEERSDGSILLSGDEVIVFISPPSMLTTGNLLPVETTTELLEKYISRTENEIDYEDIETIAELNAVKADFSTDLETLDFMSRALVMAREIDDTFIIVLASGQDVEQDIFESTVFDIAGSIEIGSFTRPGDITGQLPTLENFTAEDSDRQWAGAMKELEALGLVRKGGKLLLDEAMVFNAFGGGGFNIHEESATEYKDFVMAALISLRPVNEGDFVFCGLITRATSTDGEGDFLIVGPTLESEIVALEANASSEDANLLRRDSPVNFHNPQHVLYFVQDQQVTLYINGEPFIENWPLVLPAEGDEEMYETLYAGTNLDLGCVMTSVWAYGIPPK